MSARVHIRFFLEQGAEPVVVGDVPVGGTLLAAAKALHAPEGDACGGVCACSTCHVYVERGAELLSEAEDDEEDILDKAFDVRSTSRLGCQSRLERPGALDVRITRESLAAFQNEHPGEWPPKHSD